MADNTALPTGGGGDTIRDLDRGSGAKTQVVQLDVGGAAANAESLVTAGNPLPVQSAADRMRVWIAMQQLQILAINQATNGFVPTEIPGFLGAL